MQKLKLIYNILFKNFIFIDFLENETGTTVDYYFQNKTNNEILNIIKNNLNNKIISN